MTRYVALRCWAGTELAGGTHQGTAVRDGALVVEQYVGTRGYADPYDDSYGDGRTVLYDYASWISPEIRPSEPADVLVPSWNARTPRGCWLEVDLRVSTDGRHMSPWYTLGRWAETDEQIHPTSVPGQDDDLAVVAFDELTARAGRRFASYQLRVSLLRPVGAAGTPSVSLLAVVASHLPAGERVEVSPGGGAWGTVLDVPTYSQQVHRGEYPQWDNGGESWCSPTCTSMLLAYWGAGPDPADYAWVDPGLQDRFVDHAARHTYDHHYEGAGNWPFNTAYAARFGLVAYVTRLRSLTEAERYVAAGVPLAVAVSFRRDELAGAGYDTTGHLLTIVGFDERGDVVSNDPASHGRPSNEEVRTTYDRAQFERAWLDGGGGVTYVVHPPQVGEQLYLPDGPRRRAAGLPR